MEYVGMLSSLKRAATLSGSAVTKKRRDSYGQQLIRESSVVHKGSQPAHGNYWVWPDE